MMSPQVSQPDRNHDHPSVAVLLPAYNAAAFIQRTLNSLSAQTYDNFQVIISVDKSSDDTAAICQRHCEQDPRFTLHRQQQQRGWVGNSNFLIDQVRADFFVFAFHDDVRRPRFIEELASALERNPSAIMSYADYTIVHSDGREEQCQFPAIQNADNAAQRISLLSSRPRYWYVLNHGMIRHAMAKDIGGLKKHRGGEYVADWPWVTAIALRGPVVHVPQTLTTKYYMRDSLSRGWRRSWQAEYHVAQSVIAEINHSSLTRWQKSCASISIWYYLLRIFMNKAAWRVGKWLGLKTPPPLTGK